MIWWRRTRPWTTVEFHAQCAELTRPTKEGRQMLLLHIPTHTELAVQDQEDPYEALWMSITTKESSP